MSSTKPARIAVREIPVTQKSSSSSIYTRLFPGRWHQARTCIQAFVFTLLSLLPWLQYEGHQAIRVNFASMTADLYALHLGPQDIFGVALLVWIAVFGLVVMTLHFGRIWCGLICPQTLWTFLYIKIETICEGTIHQRQKLDRQSWSFRKLKVKTIKHLLWLSIAFYTSLVVHSVVVSPNTLMSYVMQGDVFNGYLLSIMSIKTFTYINAGLMRERFCQHVCPYAKFQSVLIDRETRVVSYKSDIGEPRFQPKVLQKDKGHCVNCNLCVQVCPAGIDIRDGFQLACIQCGACIDACQHVMRKKKKLFMLIDFKPSYLYSGINKKAYQIKRVLGISILALSMFVFMFYVQSHEPLHFDIIRDRQTLYRVNKDKDVLYPITLDINNTTDKAQLYTWRLNPASFLTLQGSRRALIPAGEKYTYQMVLFQPNNKAQNKKDIQLSTGFIVCMGFKENVCKQKKLKLAK